MTYLPSIVKSLQRGTVTATGGNATGNATVTAVNTSFASLRYLGRTESNGGSGDGIGYIQLLNSTTVQLIRAFTAGNNIVSWELVEYQPFFIKSIQRGVISCSGAGNTATITSVNTAKAHLNYLGNYTNDNASGNSSEWFVRLDLTNATTVTATIASGLANYQVSFEVIEFW